MVFKNLICKIAIKALQRGKEGIFPSLKFKADVSPTPVPGGDNFRALVQSSWDAAASVLKTYHLEDHLAVFSL